jgi:hypothetical protein
METINNAILLEIGEIKVSKFWTNIYLKFRSEDGLERWYYYSEHIDKAPRLKQILDFLKPNICKVGMTMTVNYKIVQSKNKSTKLSIVNLANYHKIN